LESQAIVVHQLVIGEAQVTAKYHSINYCRILSCFL
jgi:hypothetical protein